MMTLLKLSESWERKTQPGRTKKSNGPEQYHMEEVQRHGVMKFLAEKPLQGFNDNVLYIYKKNIEWRNSVIKQGYEKFVKLGRELFVLVQNMFNDLKCIGVKYMKEDGQTIDTVDAISKSFEVQIDMVRSATVVTKKDLSTIAKNGILIV